MTTRTSLSRAAVAALCSLTLTLPASASAKSQEPEAEGEAAAAPEDVGTTDELSSRASEHVTKAIALFNSSQYSNAEEELKRAAFFAPKWRPLHFNMAVLAEAQGKLGTAISEYKKFKPHATPDESLIVDQRLFELDDRRKKIAGSYKKQIGIGTGAMILGAGGLGGGIYLVTALIANNKEIERREKQAAQFMTTADTAGLEKKKMPFLYGAAIGITAGLLIIAYSVLPLSKAIKSKRQLDGIALGPTRLKWNGGVGATLKF